MVGEFSINSLQAIKKKRIPKLAASNKKTTTTKNLLDTLILKPEIQIIPREENKNSVTTKRINIEMFHFKQSLKLNENSPYNYIYITV